MYNQIKSLVCLLALALALPLAAQTTVAQWAFTTDNNTPPESGTVEATTGSGTMSFYSSSGYSLAADSYPNGSLCFKAPANSTLSAADFATAANHNNYVQVVFSTKGYTNPTLSFTYAADTNSYWHVAYSTNGGEAWTVLGTYTTANAWYVGMDFSDIALSATNKDEVIVRIFNGANGNGYSPFDTRVKTVTITAEEVATEGDMQAKWVFDQGTSGQEATLSDATLFATTYMTIGSNLSYYGKSTDFGTTLTQIQPVETISSGSISEDNKLEFCITPQVGVTFTPTNVSFEALRYGTSGGYFNIYLEQADGTRTELATSVNPNRNGSSYSTETSLLSYDISGISTTEEVKLVIYIHNLANNKQVGLANITIAGTYEGIPEEVATYTLTTAVNPEGAATISQTPLGTEFNVGTKVTLTATANFGYEFENWTDANGNVVSTTASFTYDITEDAVLTANYNELTTYSLDFTVNGAPSYMVSFSDEGSTIDGTRYYEAGTEVQLTASNNAVYTFTNYSDGTTSATNTFKVNSDMALEANYSNVGFICGWDFYKAGSSERAGDIYNESTNQGKLSLRKADGTTNSWLDRSALSSNPLYCNRYAIVNWKPLADCYYYEASFSTKGYYNIHVLSGMLLAYNGYSVQRLEVSTDGENFTLVGEITIAERSTWYDTDFELPSEAENQDKIYVRWIPDYSSDIIGTESTSDGTSMSEIYILADQVLEDDFDAPTVVATVPADGATGITASGSIVITFNETVKAGEGDVTLDGTVLSDVTYSGASVLYRYNNLDYNTSHTVTIPEGAIVDRSGNAFAGMTLSFTTMDRNTPEPRLYDAIVAQDGSGDYESVIDAIAAAPTNRTSPWLIFVKEGYYKGHVEIPTTKPYIYLIGQDKEKVTVTDTLLCGGDNAVHVSLGATVVAKASDFYAEGISFENEYGVLSNAGPQALAMYTNNDRACFYNCKLRSYQDTYLTSTNAATDRHYLKDCFIEGAVDFIYGAGDCLFDECTINIVRTSGGYIVAPNHPSSTKWGYVFDHNTITAPTTPASSTSVWLGRPWHNSCMTVFLYTTAEVTIPAAGWYETMGTIPAIFADYMTMDADGNLLDLSNRRDTYYYTDDDGNKIYGTAKNSLTDEEAAEYTYSNILSGSDYWNPREIMESVAAPQNVKLTEASIAWDAVEYAMCYVVLRNDSVIGFTTDTSYELSDVQTTDIYTVQAANEYGSLGAQSDAVSLATTGIAQLKSENRFAISRTANGIAISGLEAGSKIDVVNAGGMLIASKRTANTEANIALSQPGVYIVRINGISTSIIF